MIFEIKPVSDEHVGFHHDSQFLIELITSILEVCNLTLFVGYLFLHEYLLIFVLLKLDKLFVFFFLFIHNENSVLPFFFRKLQNALIEIFVGWSKSAHSLCILHLCFIHRCYSLLSI